MKTISNITRGVIMLFIVGCSIYTAVGMVTQYLWGYGLEGEGLHAICLMLGLPGAIVILAAFVLLVVGGMVAVTTWIFTGKLE
jgi:hypothetical protein